MDKLRERLIEAGWTISCQRFIDIGGSDNEQGQRNCTYRATKDLEELVVRGKLNEEQVALRYLYDMVKSIDPDLQQLSMEAGSGGWVFDLSQTESELHGKKL